MRPVLLGVLWSCSGVDTHVAVTPVSYQWGEPSGKASFPIVLAFNGGPLVHPIGRLGYGVVVLESGTPPEVALQVIEALRNTVLRWDQQLLIVGMGQGAAGAIALAQVKASQGVALLMDSHDPNELQQTPIYYQRFDAMGPFVRWLCEQAHARDCPPRPPSERYSPEKAKALDEDLQLTR